MSEIFLKCL